MREVSKKGVSNGGKHIYIILCRPYIFPGIVLNASTTDSTSEGTAVCVAQVTGAQARGHIAILLHCICIEIEPIFTAGQTTALKLHEEMDNLLIKKNYKCE